MDKNKLGDLRKLLKFLDGEAYAFYSALIDEQQEIQPTDTASIQNPEDTEPPLNPLQMADLQEIEEIREVEATVI